MAAQPSFVAQRIETDRAQRVHGRKLRDESVLNSRVEADPDVALRRHDRLARVQAHPHPHLPARERALALERGGRVGQRLYTADRGHVLLLRGG